MLLATHADRARRSPGRGRRALAVAAALLGCGEGTTALTDDDAAFVDETPEPDRTPDADTEPDDAEADDVVEALEDVDPLDDVVEPLDAVTARDVAITPFDAVTARDVVVAPMDVVAPRDVVTPRDVVAPRDVVLPPMTGLLLRDGSPMACADPAVFSADDAGARFFVYCTGMSHVWSTADWARFDDRRGATRFDLSGMSANGRQIGAWWAPSVAYAPSLDRYVMWVSVPDARATHDASGWNTRSLAVLTATTPTGPWVYRGIGLAATAAGQHYIDPFLFRDHDGRRYVFFKRYGGGLASSIVGAAVDASWQHVTAGTQVEIMNGYGGDGTWELNVRENPAVVYDAATGHHHMLFSGAHWDDASYATGHAVSACGPLCVRAGAGWRITSSGDRGIVQVVRSRGDARFAHGGPGGAEFQDDRARFIVYAAAPRSARGDATRYLLRDAVRWRNDAPYVDNAGHLPGGF